MVGLSLFLISCLIFGLTILFETLFYSEEQHL